MKHDFDKVIDRRNTNSVKYDFAAECGMPEDVLPLLGGRYGFSSTRGSKTKAGRNQPLRYLWLQQQQRRLFCSSTEAVQHSF